MPLISHRKPDAERHNSLIICAINSPMKRFVRLLPWLALFAVTALVVLAPALFPGNMKLYNAIDAGDTAEVQRLLEDGADPNSRSCGITGRSECTLQRYQSPPVLFAVYSNQPQIVFLLLEAGADPDARDRQGGQTALIEAANAGMIDIVRALIEEGVDVTAARTSDGETPLHYGPNGPGGLYPDWGNQPKELEPEIRAMLEQAGAR